MISKQDIEHLSKLARIDISEKEKESLASDLEAILRYVAVLQNAETGNEEFIHFTHLEEGVRDDERNAVDENEEAIRAKKLIEAAPGKEKGYVKVKSILDK